MPNASKPPILEENLLKSWKEISAYLNCGERTAKRWEKTRGLPVHRLPGGPSEVFVSQDEIDAWRANAPGSRPPGRDQEPATPDARSEAVPRPADPALLLASPSYAHLPVSEPRFGGTPPGRLRRTIAVGALLAVLGLLAAAMRGRPHDATAPTAAVHIAPQNAVDLYLDGRYYWNKRTPEDFKAAMQRFQQAVAIDPFYAAPYAGIADVYALSPEFAAMSPAEAYPKMAVAAQKAIGLDPNLAEGHRALGFELFYWNWDKATAKLEFERAIALDGHNATTYLWFANALRQGGDCQGALSLIDRARELEPTSRPILADRALVLDCVNRFSESAQIWDDLERSDPNYLPPHTHNADFSHWKGDAQTYLRELKSIAQITRTPRDAGRLRVCQQAFADRGTRGLLDAAATFDQQVAKHDGVGYFNAAFSLDAAGRDQETLQYLELAYQNRDPQFTLLTMAGHFTRLVGKPRFEYLKARSQQPYTRDDTPRG